MIRMIQSNSASHAKAYFSDALQKSDYYLDDQELRGNIQGKLADRIGITGPATKEIFFDLCENKNPRTGGQLTLRTKEQRRTGYDINFHCPKSVSIVHSLSKDSHVLKAFEESVQETMFDIEHDSKTRIRKAGVYDDRKTGELIWADFTHQTARPVEGMIPDPHLHSHCFVFNATWDAQEKQCKAGQFGDIKRDMPYYQARFHKRLSDKMIALGYDIRRTDKSFEVAGVPQQVIDHFSKRTNEIGEVARQKGITDAKALDQLGAKTRAKKEKGYTMSELKENWRNQIRNIQQDENELTAPIRFTSKEEMQKLSANVCIDHALQHSFERASVMGDRRILEKAYRYSLNNTGVTISGIDKCFSEDEKIIHVTEKHRTLCTTREVLSEEKQMVQLARNGQNKLKPLYSNVPVLQRFGQQASAIGHILTNTHRISIIRGAAGTGKTAVMQDAIALIEKAGKNVTVLAPTANASRGVLREEGFEEADTVAHFLANEKMQNKIDNQVLWIDEAGLLGTKDMKRLLQIATEKNARLILGGDTRQHASVIRGDALRILNTVAGIQTAEVNKIYRQKNEPYRKAVEDLSKGNMKPAFEKLDAMGVIKTIDPLKPNEELVDDYLKAMKKGKKAIVISPTHKQGEEVTQAIRKKLKRSGLIGKKEITALKLTNSNLTEAEKADWRNFKKEHIIKFNQNVTGIKKGSSWTIEGISAHEITIKSDKNQLMSLPTEKSITFDLYQPSEISLAKGDKILINKNGFDAQKKRLNNGQSLEVTSVSKKGKIVLKNVASKATYILDKGFGHITHAHCITSHASQGKTVDAVFIAQPSSTFSATDAKQFYVSVSRAREDVKIYTDDKEALFDHASAMRERQSAIELVGKKSKHTSYIKQQIYNTPTKENSKFVPLKNISFQQRSMNKDYEPEL